MSDFRTISTLPKPAPRPPKAFPHWALALLAEAFTKKALETKVSNGKF